MGAETGQIQVTPSRTGDGFLTHERVVEVYGRCLGAPGPGRGRVEVHAWAMIHTLRPSRLQRYREEIVRMLLCLPRGFRVDERGGGSVMIATLRDDGTYWTNDMSAVERLIALGMGIGLVTFCSPRETWHRLPGGVPFVRVGITRFGVKMN